MFDPKKYLAEDTQEESTGFDPKAFLSSKTETPTTEPEDTDVSSKLFSSAAGATKGLTAGLADEAYGLANKIPGVAKATNYLTDLAAGTDTPSPGWFGDKSYSEYRDESRNVYKQAEKDNPKSFMAGQIGGGIASGLVGGVPASTGKLLARAGMEGAAYGLGESEADLTKGEFKEAALDTAKGAGIGVVSAGAMKAAPKVLSAVGKTRPMQWAKQKVAGKANEFLDSLRDMGAEGATDIMKATPADKVKLGRVGVTTVSGETSNVANEMPKYLKEMGITLKEGMNPFSTLKSLHKKVLVNMDKAGKKIGMIEDKYSDVMSKLKDHPNIPDSFKIKLGEFEKSSGVDILDMAVGLEKKITEEFGSNPVFKSQMKKVNRFLDDMVEMGAENAKRYDLVDGRITSLKGLQRYRKDVDKVIQEFSHPGNKKITAYQELLSDTRGFLSAKASDMTDKMDQLGKLLQDAPDGSIRKISKEAQGLTKQLRQANRDYTMGSHASSLIEKGQNKKGSMFSIKDLMLGFGGGVLGDPTLGAGLFVAKKAADIAAPRLKMKAPAVADAFETMGKMVPKDSMQKASTALQGPLRQPFVQQQIDRPWEADEAPKSPSQASQGTKYQQMFGEDERQNAVNHKVLMNSDPDYRKLHLKDKDK